MAKKTLRSVSFGEQLRKNNLHTANRVKTAPLLLPLPLFPHVQSSIYYGLIPCITALSSFLIQFCRCWTPIWLLPTKIPGEDTHTLSRRDLFTAPWVQPGRDHVGVPECQQPLLFHYRKSENPHLHYHPYTHRRFNLHISPLFKRTTGRFPGKQTI